MKIQFPGVSSGQGEYALSFCGQGRDEGSFTGTVPVTLKHTGVYTTKTVEKTVSITSSTTTNRRGVRSGVVKVTMPFHALIADGNGGFTLDSARSGAEMSMHVVLALPASAASDMRSGDAAIKDFAEQQVAVLAFILSSLMQGLLTNPVVKTSGGAQVDATYSAGPVSVQDPSMAQVSDTEVLQGKKGGVRILESQYGANAGIEADSALNVDARNLINRIARSLPALSCENVNVSAYFTVEP